MGQDHTATTTATSTCIPLHNEPYIDKYSHPTPTFTPTCQPPTPSYPPTITHSVATTTASTKESSATPSQSTTGETTSISATSTVLAKPELPNTGYPVDPLTAVGVSAALIIAGVKLMFKGQKRSH